MVQNTIMSALNKYRLLREARKNQWLRPEELQKLQDKKLRAIIKHAYNNTEFYRKKFDAAGIKPDDIKTTADLYKIPFTTKQEVRENSLTTMLAKGTDLKKCIIRKTSGSSGIPMKVAYDSPAEDYSKAVNLRSMTENGLGMWSRFVNIGDTRAAVKPTWFQKLGIYRLQVLSMCDKPEDQIEQLQKINPQIIVGYPSELNLIARQIKENNIKGINPKMIFTSAEWLSPDIRELVNSVFNLELIDLFGCIEVNRTAWECSEHQGYHLDVDSVITEFVKDNENVAGGEKGEIVYTCLYNYAMPLIRYKIGDIGIPSNERCSCGRSLPLMKSVEGRQDDYITLPSGAKIPPLILACGVMKYKQEVAEYQIVQEEINKIKAYVVVENTFDQQKIHELQKELEDKLNNEVRAEVIVKDKIQRGTTGKLRAITSKIKL